MPPPKPAATAAGGKDAKPKRQRKTKTAAAPAAATDAPMTDAGRIEVLAAQLEAATRRNEESEKKCSYLQLELDRVEAFFEVARAEAEAAGRDGRFKDIDLEAEEDRHLVALNELRQRIKHLAYGHDRERACLKQEAEAAVRAAVDQNGRRLLEDYEEKAALKALNREQVIRHQEWTAALQLEHSKTATRLRPELEASAKELEVKAAARAAAAAADASLRLRSEVAEVEERKGDHIQRLIAEHDQAQKELKALYEATLAERLSDIEKERENAAATTTRAEVAEGELAALKAGHAGMLAPLAQAQSEVAALRLQLQDYEKTKEELIRGRGRLAASDKRLRALESDHEVQRQELDGLKAEHIALLANSEAAELQRQRQQLVLASCGAAPSRPDRSVAAASPAVSQGFTFFRHRTSGGGDGAATAGGHGNGDSRGGGSSRLLEHSIGGVSGVGTDLYEGSCWSEDGQEAAAHSEADPLAEGSEKRGMT